MVLALIVATAFVPDGLGAQPTSGPQAPSNARPAFSGIDSSSFYLEMSDGVEIAVDLHVPRGLEPGARVPAILHQTRYWRSVDIRFPFDLFMDGQFVLWGSYRRYFLERGYAWVDVDVRGTGASFGVWKHSYWTREVEDGGEILDWIVSQPWSDGRVAAWGVSYAGGAAEMLLASGHPAVKAVVPMFSPFDVYDEIGFPGGVLSSWYVKEWAEVNELLDANQPPVDSWFEKLAARGVRPVDGPEGRTKLALAVADRNGNVDVSEEASFVTFRDDASPSIRTLDDMSPHASRARAAATSIPIYGYSGWFDGAYAHAAIRRFMTDDNPLSRIRIGPWDHGGGRHRSPFAPAASTFDHRGEVLRFLDAHVRGIDTGILEEPRVRYFVMGAEEWRSSEGWPPAGNEPAPLFLTAGRALSPQPPREPSADLQPRFPEHRSGVPSRWTGLVSSAEGPLLYPGRTSASDGTLHYDTPPLGSSVEVSGHPEMTLFVSASESDAAVFAYLEDVSPDGHVTYVTEGSLRLLHRDSVTEDPPYEDVVAVRSYDRASASPLVPGEQYEVTFDLLPTSYRFPAGHAIRVTLAIADADYFAPVGGDELELTVISGPSTRSRIMLPTAGAFRFRDSSNGE